MTGSPRSEVRIDLRNHLTTLTIRLIVPSLAQ